MKSKTISLSIILLFIILRLGCTSDPTLPPGTDFGSVSGKITEEGTTLPIQNVTITTNPASATVYTSVTGDYYLAAVPPGTVTVIAKRNGYTVGSGTVTVSERGSATKNLQIAEVSGGPYVMPLSIGNRWNYGIENCVITSSAVDTGIQFYSSACWSMGYSHGFLISKNHSGELEKIIPKQPAVGDMWKRLESDANYYRVLRKDTINVTAGRFICFVVRQDNNPEPPSYWSLNIGLVRDPDRDLASYSIH